MDDRNSTRVPNTRRARVLQTRHRPATRSIQTSTRHPHSASTNIIFFFLRFSAIATIVFIANIVTFLNRRVRWRTVCIDWRSSGGAPFVSIGGASGGATPALQPVLRSVAKTELAADTGLNLRDIRVVDPSFRQEAAAIIVRSKAVIIKMEHVRALIQANRMLLFDPMHPSVRAFVPELQARLVGTNSHLPFEQRAIEAVLINVCASVHRHMATLAPAVESVLDTLSSSGSTDFGSESVQTSLDRLLPLENSLNEFLATVTQLRVAMNEVLSSDQDMSEMYLTSMLETGHRRRHDQHEEVEMMFENYLKQIDAVLMELNATLRAVKSTENVTQIRLDAMRNRVLRLEVYLNIATVSLAAGGVVAGVFGMNLLSGLEEDPHAFAITSAAAFATVLLTFRGILTLLRVRRIFR